METNTLSTEQKALRINLDGDKHGTFAEVGAGQEVVRWFFHVGRASATVAKSMSAYDTLVSDDIYGPTDHYVSRQRLEAMLSYEYLLLLKRMDEKRGANTAFFVYAETVATRSRRHQRGGHGWLGIRFQTRPRSAPSDIIVHVQLLDPVVAWEQEALGELGVNLIYGAFYQHQEPQRLIGMLMDGLNPARVEVDMIKFSGPAFRGVDNRLMSLQLVEQRLTDTTMFTAEGEVIQPSEVLENKPVVIERGSFRPITNVTLDMLNHGLAEFQKDGGPQDEEPVVLAEMTQHNLMSKSVIDHQDFLARVDTLGALGRMVMISNYTRFDLVTSYLRKYTQNRIAMIMGVPTLRQIFDERHYTELGGGILEALGRLLQGEVRLYVYPMGKVQPGEVITAESLEVPPNLRHLYAHLLENGYVKPIHEYEPKQLGIFPDEVLAKIQAGDAAWEALVPPPVAGLIKAKGLFGYRAMPV